MYLRKTPCAKNKYIKIPSYIHYHLLSNTECLWNLTRLISAILFTGIHIISGTRLQQIINTTYITGLIQLLQTKRKKKTIDTIFPNANIISHS